MILKQISVGMGGANCYIAGCPETKEAAVIDPGGDVPRILEVLDQEGLKLKYIINTHGHIDHIEGNEDLKKATGAQILIHKEDGAFLEDPRKNLSVFFGGAISLEPADRLLEEGDTILVGSITLEVIHTPGHTQGGICLKAGDIVFTGDTLFAGSIGRTDFPTGSYDNLISSIKKKLLTLPEDTKIYPGHMGASTIGDEKRHNPFLA